MIGEVIVAVVADSEGPGQRRRHKIGSRERGQIDKADAIDEVIAHDLGDAMAALETVGLPAIIRPSFTLGGTGGGIAYNREDYIEIVTGGVSASSPRTRWSAAPASCSRSRG